MLAILPLILPFIAFALLVLVPLFIFVIYPRLRDSKTIDDISKQFDHEVTRPESTKEVISQVEESKKTLRQKKVQDEKVIKGAKKDKETIDKFLDEKKPDTKS